MGMRISRSKKTRDLRNKGLKQLIREGKAVDRHASFDNISNEQDEAEFDLFLRCFGAELRAKRIRKGEIVYMTLARVKYYKNLKKDNKGVTPDELFIRDSIRDNKCNLKLF